MAATLAEIKSRMLLPRPPSRPRTARRIRAPSWCGACRSTSASSAPREGIDALPRLERDVWSASAELRERQVVRALPQVTLQEMLLAFKDVVARSEMFAHHHIQRERLSVRERMSDILAALAAGELRASSRSLFRPEEGRMGVTVTFVAILELMREGADRHRAGRSLRAAARARREPAHVRCAWSRQCGPRRPARPMDSRGTGTDEDRCMNDAYVRNVHRGGAAGRRHAAAAGGAGTAVRRARPRRRAEQHPRSARRARARVCRSAASS